MGIPQVPDQVKKAPTLALRAFFAGIGKILLATDRQSDRASAGAPASPPADLPGSAPASPPADLPGSAPASPPASPPADLPASSPRHAAPGRRVARTAAAVSPASHRWRSLDRTGNVRVLAAEERASAPSILLAPDGASSGVQDHGKRGTPQPAGTPVPPQPLTGNVPVGASLVIHELPLPGYNTMSVAAIRARLRFLDVDKLQALLVYEQKNAKRPDIIAMIERRIRKIEAGE